MAIPDLTTWLSPAITAVRIDRTPARVRQLANTGVLRAVRTPIGRLIDPDSIETYLRERERAAAERAEGSR